MKAPILLPLVLGISASAIGDELLISQYVEGSSSNKAIEIYNPTDSAVSLTGYTLSIYFNGKTAAGANIELSGSIAAQSTQVIASSSAGDTLKALADVLTSQSMFNGDDAIVLTDSSGWCGGGRRRLRFKFFVFLCSISFRHGFSFLLCCQHF